MSSDRDDITLRHAITRAQQGKRVSIAVPKTHGIPNRAPTQQNVDHMMSHGQVDQVITDIHHHPLQRTNMYDFMSARRNMMGFARSGRA